MKNYNQVYGKFTSGAGGWLDEKIFSDSLINSFSDTLIDNYITQISIDINRLDPKFSINKKVIMDVGTGRQALAFSKLGADIVDHFDISENNIELFNNHLSKQDLSIISKQQDICDKSFVISERLNRYDCVYLQGIIHHVKDPYKALKNISLVTKKDGIIWLYFHQCGSALQIYWEIIRLILEDVDIELIFSSLKNLNFNDKDISIIIDSVGCTYRHLIKSDFYINTMKKFGFKQIMNKDIYDNTNGLNLRVTTPGCIAGFKKIDDTEAEQNIRISSEFIDHFDYKNYRKEDQDFIKILKLLYEEIKFNLKATQIKKSKYKTIFAAIPLINEALKYKFFSSLKFVVQKNLLNSMEESLNILKKT